MTKGILYLVGTPIGNLEDITMRGLRILGEVDVIAAEDTRETLVLLSHYGIKKRLISYREYNKVKSSKYIIDLIDSGKSVALVCDRGMPGISDAGVCLVKQVVENGIEVIAVPGPTALITSLVVSGFSTGGFVFEGFLPRKKGKLRKVLTELGSLGRTAVVYESPHRILKTLEEMLDVWGDCNIVICRELTKKFEEVIRGKVSAAIKHFSDVKPRGEFTIVVESLK